ncbi:uncharacterized protein LOC128282154 [Gossypium arboreum]|uniref:uncharacterized protein LOC128282154 n=1 Tax=Gossypium arboreum TaxID=29729 RepID=UPI0022F1CF17|nr:uncharacterized protein LOC128282154 [Gossypium arboreum]
MEGFESSKRATPVKKKEAKAHMVGTKSHHTSNPYTVQPRPRYRLPQNFYYPPQSPYYQAPPPYPVYATDNQRPFAMFPPNTMPAQNQPKNEQRPARFNPEKPQFTQIPVLYRELYPKLLEKRLISPHYMAPLKPPHPKWYDPNASCMYHAENQWHSTENCLAFKRRVQGLIDAGILRFDGAGNTARNLLPNHTEGNVSVMIKEDRWHAKSCVSEIKTPMRKIWEVMVEKWLFCHPNRTFKEGRHDIQSCEEFKKLLQDMMDNKEIWIFNKEADEGEVCASDNKLSSNKAVLWKYDVNIIIPEDEKSKATTRKIGEVGHFTPNGRCYSKVVEPMKKTNDLKQKGNAPMHEAEVELENPFEQEVKRPVNEEEAREFLKFIKHSEYNVVEQLSKQPVQISILSLLLNSEPDRNTLLKVDDEIPPNGRGSVKALHITTRCKGYIIPNVLIDNGSALKVMPLATLSRIPIDLSYLRPCHSTVRVFDGMRREAMGNIKIPLEVGLYIYDIEFQVMDITPLYNCLLGRPWIHSAGVVPSSLHQKLKFIMDGLLVTVVGEEDIVASISACIPYLEVSKDAVECSFRSFEFINATFVAKGNKILMPKPSRNTKMGIKLTMGKGARARKGLGRYQQGIVRALKPVPHKARYGLGFEPDMRQRRKHLQKDRERNDIPWAR